MANDPFAKVVEFADAGKDKFNELVHARSFLRKVKLRTQGDRWFVFDGKAWQLRQKELYRGLALNLLPTANRMARHAKAVMDHVEMDRQMAAEEELRGAVAFDGEAVVVNCANGVLRVTAGGAVLEKHSEKWHFTGVLPAEWNEGAEAPLFMKAASEALEGDEQDMDLLQWFSGYLLFPDCKQHEVFLICFGPSGTGKSTVAEAVMGTIGDDPLVMSLSMSQICAGDKAYSLPGLERALVNIGTELDTVEVEDSANFKKLVSGEVIEARTIYGRPFPMRTSAKFWFNANDLPRFKHGTDAELRRARFLCFDVQRPSEQRDRTLKNRLRAERDGVFRWMVAGLQTILQGVTCPEGGTKAAGVKAQFAVSNDPVRAFFDDRLERSPDGWVAKADVDEAFRQFMDHRGFPARAKEQLFRALYQRFPFIQPRRRRDSKGELFHVLAGVELREARAD